jgi:uncharacterized delta-60 repeat protein
MSSSNREIHATKTQSRVRRILTSAVGMLIGAAGAVTAAPGNLDTSWGGAAAGIVVTNIEGFNDVSSVVMVQADDKVVTAGHCNNALFCLARYAADGSLDTSFNAAGTLGKNILSLGSTGGFNRVYAGQIQADGKIVLAGVCATKFCVARFNANGTTDLTFNATGGFGLPLTPGYNVISTNFSAATPNFSLSYDRMSLGIQSNGSIVLIGACNTPNADNPSTCLIRFKADGTVDSAFSGNARALVEFSFTPIGIAVNKDDTLLAIGSCSGQGLCAKRYSAGGSLTANIDIAIGRGGSSVAKRSDGKLFIVGDREFIGGEKNADFYVVALNPDGSRDTSFGMGGVATISAPSSSLFEPSIALQPDGRIVVASGACARLGAKGPCAARFSPTGIPDKNFASQIFSYGTGQADNFYVGIATQRDGKILLAHQKTYPNSSGSNQDVANFATLRLESGPTYVSCNMDVDGDGQYVATIDGLIITRIMLGITGSSVLNGLTINPVTAARKDWPSVRNYLNEQCGMTVQ